MDIQTIRQLLGWMQQAQLSQLSLTTADRHILLRRGQPIAQPGKAVVAAASTVVQAPSAGVFLTHHPARAEPLMAAGSAVRQGDRVALLRIDTLLLPVAATADGILSEPLSTAGELVGYGADLFAIGESAGITGNQP